jgi:hypothetical protein
MSRGARTTNSVYGDYLLHCAARANKPKALSARTTVKLGTKTRSEGRAVLVSAKTMPCPDKLASLVGTFAAFVHLNRSLTGHKRDTLTLNDRKRQEGAQKCRAGGAPAYRQGRLSDKQRQRHPGTLRRVDAVFARATFWGAKPITGNGRYESRKSISAYIAPPSAAPRRGRQLIQSPTSTRAALRARAARADGLGARGGGKSDQGTIGCALRWTGNSQD